jgi:hypothetical protein
MKQRDKNVRKEIQTTFNRKKKVNIAYVQFNNLGLCTFYNFARNAQQRNMYGQHLFVDIHPTKASGM